MFTCRNPLFRNCCLALLLTITASNVPAAQVVVPGPAEDIYFGSEVRVLPNGNLAVSGNNTVYLYRPDGTRISTLSGPGLGRDLVILPSGNFLVLSPSWGGGVGAVTFVSGESGLNGSVSADNSLIGEPTHTAMRVGEAVDVLSNGDFLVRSPAWRQYTGAVTYGSGVSGVRGVVSAANSLTGSQSGDYVGQMPSTDLGNGNFLIRSPRWANGNLDDVGAVTFGSASRGLRGVVSAENSLIGSAANDQVGYDDIIVLAHGNYVVPLPYWSHGALSYRGAVVWGSGTTGVSGVVSPALALVGSSANDRVGLHGVTALSNGNYVVSSPHWNHAGRSDAGAATFCNGSSGCRGAITPQNSLVGGNASDRVAGGGVTALRDGNYVVVSPDWRGLTSDSYRVGAVTWGSGDSGILGIPTAANSLIGAVSGSSIGEGGVVALPEGNFVVGSPNWYNGSVAGAGAATFIRAGTGTSGTVTASNSLVGSRIGDRVGSWIHVLTNGNYVVSSPGWKTDPLATPGAFTFATWTHGITGSVSPENSLIGTQQTNPRSLVPLSNGNFVIVNSLWRNGLQTVGAVIFASGLTGISGTISAANPLIGGQEIDLGVIPLVNGNYLVASRSWDAGNLPNVGAIVFGSGVHGVTGTISADNALVGSTAHDNLSFRSLDFGDTGIRTFPNGAYVVHSSYFDHGGAADAGAITLGLPDGTRGTLSLQNSVFGVTPGAGMSLAHGYDPERNQLAVGNMHRRELVLHRPGIATTTTLTPPAPSEPGESVPFIARITASNAPSDGRVRFVASSGSVCVDETHTPVDGVTTEFSCSLPFDRSGSYTIHAEYLGSREHAYSRSAFLTHAVGIHADGFETP